MEVEQKSGNSLSPSLPPLALLFPDTANILVHCDLRHLFVLFYFGLYLAALGLTLHLGLTPGRTWGTLEDAED